MDARNKFLVVGATLLPAVVVNEVGYGLNHEIHTDEWQRDAPDQHHTPDEAPSAQGTPADTSGVTDGGDVSVFAVGETFTVGGGRLLTESGDFILMESGGFIELESRDYVVTSV
jgi:hypothetical protein